ncbi:unnamed protein product [Macrosiphum euphorbiae]|uniref:Uncharacterized protein n=1 Tax=Macrosiphum euphorbiae TaxID=13131 RepID=A0AAV0WIN1_9HEMI|nr:unnamed protein product [Macrosiphum euphorbiae]
MPTPIPLPATHETTIASKIKSYANVTKNQTEKTEPTINASKLLQIIKDLLTTTQESEDIKKDIKKCSHHNSPENHKPSLHPMMNDLKILSWN